MYEELDEELQKHFEEYLAEVGRLCQSVCGQGWPAWQGRRSEVGVAAHKTAGVSGCGTLAILACLLTFHIMPRGPPACLQRGVDAQLGAYLLPLIHDKEQR